MTMEPAPGVRERSTIRVRTRYPEVHDWLLRKAMVCEAHGETELAIEYCERRIALMDAHPADFDPESREPFCKGNYVFD